MSYQWVRENAPKWDQGKAELVGDAPAGIFDTRYGELTMGDAVPDEWWRVEEEGKLAGYAWLDVEWGDAEILLVTAPQRRKNGVGAFVIEHLAKEAHKRGLRYMYNVVRPAHPDKAGLEKWLAAQGFVAQADGRWTKAVSS